MASLAKTVSCRLGQSAARIRASSALGSRLQPSTPCAYSRSAYRAVTAASQRRPYATAGGIDEVQYAPLDTFPRRHIGPDEADTVEMLKALSPPVESLDEFVKQVIPPDIFAQKPPRPFPSLSESTLLEKFKEYRFVARGKRDKILISQKKSFIGQGYYGTHTPSVIQRNVLENPAWYTSYTPYQPEISQGRLESLMNFQTMVTDLTALPIANASLLDEGTAGAEAMTLSMNALPTSRAKREGKTFVVSASLHPQTIEVLRGRADGFGIKILELDLPSDDSHTEIEKLGEDLVGVMVQYPDTYGRVDNFESLAELVHKQGALLSVATDLLALTVLKPPGEWGADIAFGSAQRFGIPMGFGGPHAAFFAVQEKHKRKMPGRLVGLSKDRLGNKAYRLALQTREQHIRREKATSNVCTSQALLANMSALYAIYHGPEGLKAIAERVIRGARIVQAIAEQHGFTTEKSKSDDGHVLFDTVIIDVGSQFRQKHATTLGAHVYDLHFRRIGKTHIGISADETITQTDLCKIFQTLQATAKVSKDVTEKEQDSVALRSHVLPRDTAEKHVRDILVSHNSSIDIPESLRRTSSFLTHPVFNTHHSETELLRYIYHLQSKDLSLVHTMIPLGSCTMKLNGTTEMSLISAPKISQFHPYTPRVYAMRYLSLLKLLKHQLAALTGMQKVSLQPNSGAQGEFAGLRAIRQYHKEKGDGKNRDICLIPVSAHGTNPASAAMAGMRVVPIKCDAATGNLDLADLEEKCKKHQDELGAIMVTYPSTYGVFEPGIRDVCKLVHDHGGLVYMDGANMNAQLGLCSPGDLGADVCHLNLHKTFCIPHGGGGPGVGPICVKQHLQPFLPRDPCPTDNTFHTRGHPVSSARNGSASIALISWAYNALMGTEGLTHATKITLLNANYILSRLKPHYEILYVNKDGRCAHEFILDTRPFHNTAGIEAIDIAKRLQDYGFHAPTMSWPVPNTLMIEPTESESKEELDRFVDALISIREEIREIEEGKVPREGNVLKMSPHTMQDLLAGDGEDGKWERVYSREKAAYPLPWLREKKFWPTVTRIDDTYGDLNLFCTCPPVEDTTSS